MHCTAQLSCRRVTTHSVLSPMRNDRYLVGTRIINRLNLSGTFEERLDFSRYSAQSFPSDPSDHFIAGGRRYAMKGRNKSPSSAKGRVLSKAFGPAAEEFGEELRPVGREVGAVAVRATRALLKPVGGLVWGFEKVEEWIAESIAPKVAGIPPQHRVEPKLGRWSCVGSNEVLWFRTALEGVICEPPCDIDGWQKSRQCPSGVLDLPRFRGVLSVWDQTI